MGTANPKKQTSPLIIVKEDMFAEVEKMGKYKFWDKERERSNRAVSIQDHAFGTKRRCPLRHERIAWSGPPHDAVRAYICLECGAAAAEPEIKDRGYEFDTIPDYAIHTIMDLDLERQAEGNPTSFGMYSGK